MIMKMREQFLTLLIEIGFLPSDVTVLNVSQCTSNKYGHNISMVKCALTAGLTPNVITYTKSSNSNNNNNNKAKSNVMSTNLRLGEVSLRGKRGDVYLHPTSAMMDTAVGNQM